MGDALAYGKPQTIWKALLAGNQNKPLEESVYWTNQGVVYRTFILSSTAGLDDIVTELATHSLYKSLAAGNADNPLTDATKWKYIGKTNKFKMFDYTRNDVTTAPGSLTIVLTPGKRVNSVALKGIQANAFTLSVSSGGGVVYSKSGTLNTRITTTWSEYFYGEFTTLKSLAFFDIPLFTDSIITVTLTATSGSVAISTAVIGSFVELGQTLTNARNDILNFSKVTRDADNNAILVPLRNIPKSKQQVLVDKSSIGKVVQLRDKLNGKPAIWYGLSNPNDGYFDAVSILGFYRNFELELGEGGKSIINLELEEV